MTDAGWEAATWEGNRRLQHQAFMALSFREKILELERMDEVRSAFERAREGRSGTPPAAGQHGSRSRSSSRKP